MSMAHAGACCVLLLSLFACQSGRTHSNQKVIIGEQPDAYSMRWVTYSRQLMTDRKAAVERMLAKDAASFWADCAVKTRQIDDWPMIRLLAEKATQSEAAEALPWLIRSWAMRSKVVDDEDRPEREAIESITREPAEALLNAMVFKGLAEQAPATQVAAWAVLVRIESAPSLRERLVAVSDENQSGFVAQLKRIAPAVDMLPTDRLAVAQMMRMAVTHDDAQWLAWSRWRDATLSDVPATLAMRHLPAMVHRNLSRDAWSREQWIKHIGQRLLGRRFSSRGDGVEEDVVVKQRPDRFTDHVEALSIADLIVIDQLLDAMNDPAFQVAVFKQADTDLSDTTTEYGGALVWNEQNKLVLAPFAPLIHRHDQAYIASTPCIEAVYLGLAHVHFHAQRHENAGWAGPSQGDLDFVDAHHVNGLVLTFLDRNTLNVDAAFPSGIVIDLGCITR